MSGNSRLALGRSRADFDDLSWAEKKLMVCAARGKRCLLGKTAPETSTRGNTIRASFLRFLALGGDSTAPVHETGISLYGAYIQADSDVSDTKYLNLQGAEIVTLALRYCNIDCQIRLIDSSGKSISLNNSSLLGIAGDRLRLSGSLHLRRISVSGEVRLLGARISGTLSCAGAKFGKGKFTCVRGEFGGVSLINFQSASETDFSASKIFADVQLSGLFKYKNNDKPCVDFSEAQIAGSLSFQKNFRAIGEVTILRAKIGGSLVCRGAAFFNENYDSLSCDGAEIGTDVFLDEGFNSRGTVRFVGTKIGGDLCCDEGRFYSEQGDALLCDRVEIGGRLFFRNVKALGSVSLNNASVLAIHDNLESWLGCTVDLDGFRYSHIDSSSPLDAESRIAWLDKQAVARDAVDGSFPLQPWTHISKILREQGHIIDAAAIDAARDDRLRAANRIADISSLKRWWRTVATISPEGDYTSFISIFKYYYEFPRLLPWIFHWFYGWFSGYGHKPIRVFYFSFSIWLIFGLLYDTASEDGIFVPTAYALLNKSGAPASCLLTENDGAINGNWTKCPHLPLEYPRFSPWAYSLDLTLPVVHLGQANNWTAATSGNSMSFNHWVRRAVWFQEIFGWVSALTLGAIASGLVKRRDGS